MSLVRTIIFIGFLVFWTTAGAHDPGLSSVSLVRYPDRIEVVTTFSETDAQWLLPEKISGISAPAAPDSTGSELVRLSASLWHLRSGDIEIVAQPATVGTALGNNVVCTQHYPIPEGDSLHFRSSIFDFLPPGHRQHVSVLDANGLVITSRLLSQAEPGFDLTLPSAPTTETTTTNLPTHPAAGPPHFAKFFRLGIEHIITGYDHLLFLFAFLITTQSLRSVLKIITSFTLAHSLTLALSAFDIVSLPSRWVEPFIAATIVFVALQNLLKRGRTTERLGLTFAFGLVHGFGFASVLRDLGISSMGTSAWRALAGFNAGVEVGQIAIAALVLPLLWHLRSRRNDELAWAPAASVFIALAGTYWLAERVGWL